MRFAGAVFASATVQLVPYLRPDTPVALAIAYVSFAALGAGFFAGTRSWLAGALSVVCGAALYGIVTHLAYGGRTTIGDFLVAETGLVLAIAPYAFLGALAGLVGGWIRGRAIHVAR